MSKLLSPGEMEPGLLVTVHRHQPVDAWVGGGAGVKTVEDRSYCGTPLRLVAVDLPYVVAKVIGSDVRVTFDTRRTHLMELSGDFVKEATQ